MCVTDFAKAFDFFTNRFNFKPSDVSTLNPFRLGLYATDKLCFKHQSWSMTPLEKT